MEPSMAVVAVTCPLLVPLPRRPGYVALARFLVVVVAVDVPFDQENMLRCRFPFRIRRQWRFLFRSLRYRALLFVQQRIPQRLAVCSWGAPARNADLLSKSCAVLLYSITRVKYDVGPTQDLFRTNSHDDVLLRTIRLRIDYRLSIIVTSNEL
jgi:hypothetical protein